MGMGEIILCEYIQMGELVKIIYIYIYIYIQIDLICSYTSMVCAYKKGFQLHNRFPVTHQKVCGYTSYCLLC